MKKYLTKIDVYSILLATVVIFPIVYFLVLAIGLFQLFEFSNIIPYLGVAFILSFLYWGFSDFSRAFISLTLFTLVVINFFLNGTYAFLLFVGLLFIFGNTRDWAIYAFIGLILFNIYTVVNYENMTTKVPRIERLKDVSNFLFHYPDYKIKIKNYEKLNYIFFPSFAYERMKNEHTKFIYPQELRVWVGTYPPTEEDIKIIEEENKRIKKFIKVLLANLKISDPEAYKQEVKDRNTTFKEEKATGLNRLFLEMLK